MPSNILDEKIEAYYSNESTDLIRIIEKHQVDGQGAKYSECDGHNR